MITGDGLLGPNRAMHATARLGFHAPSLVVADGQFTKAQIELAYNIAIAGLGALSQRKNAWWLPDSLLTTILTTPPEQMTFVETTIDAGRLNIPVVGTVFPDKISALAAANACTKNFAYLQGVDPDFQTVFGTVATDRLGISPQREKNPDDGRERLTLSGFGDEGNWHSCSIDLLEDTRGAFDALTVTNPRRDSIASITWDVAEQIITSSMFFDNRLALRDLARSRDDVIEVRSVLDLTAPDEERQAKGICSVWRDQVQKDLEPCEMALLTTTSEDVVRSEVRTFTWPSGSKTVVVEDYKHASVWAYVNGSDAFREYDAEYRQVPNGSCWLNQGSGNTFCFEELAG
ncbi:MAG: hypothetical protein MK160_02445 [Rhodobacteraceae bacterium]|nr:hypothetical protein [Paracoccaceae bacterium]